MSGFLEFLDRVGPVAAGGGAVQVIIWFIKRRGESRKLDADTDATVVASASASVVLASKLRDEANARVQLLEEKVTLLQEQVSQLAGQVAAERRAIAAAAVREAALNNEIAILKAGSS
jgi:hypothetical protein